MRVTSTTMRVAAPRPHTHPHPVRFWLIDCVETSQPLLTFAVSVFRWNDYVALRRMLMVWPRLMDKLSVHPRFTPLVADTLFRTLIVALCQGQGAGASAEIHTDLLHLVRDIYSRYMAASMWVPCAWSHCLTHAHCLPRHEDMLAVWIR